MLKEEEYLSKPYRPGVGLMIVNKDKKIFVGSRIEASKKYSWQMPQGGIDEGETAEQAALRELYEETGIKSVRIIAQTPNWYYYDVPERMVSRLWDGKYRGQKHKWFLLEFFGDEKEINLKAASHPEFSKWQWVDLKNLVSIVIPFKRRLYQEIILSFTKFLQ